MAQNASADDAQTTTELDGDDLDDLSEGDVIQVRYESKQGDRGNVQEFEATVQNVDLVRMDAGSHGMVLIGDVDLSRTSTDDDFPRRRLSVSAGSMTVENRRCSRNGAVWASLSTHGSVEVEAVVPVEGDDEDAQDDDEDDETDAQDDEEPGRYVNDGIQEFLSRDDDEDEEEVEEVAADGGQDPDEATGDRYEVPDHGDLLSVSYTSGDGSFSTAEGIVTGVRAGEVAVVVSSTAWDSDVQVRLPLDGDEGSVVGFDHGYAEDAWTVHKTEVLCTRSEVETPGFEAGDTVRYADDVALNSEVRHTVAAVESGRVMFRDGFSYPVSRVVAVEDEEEDDDSPEVATDGGPLQDLPTRTTDAGYEFPEEVGLFSLSEAGRKGYLWTADEIDTVLDSDSFGVKVYQDSPVFDYDVRAGRTSSDLSAFRSSGNERYGVYEDRQEAILRAVEVMRDLSEDHAQDDEDDDEGDAQDEETVATDGGEDGDRYGTYDLRENETTDRNAHAQANLEQIALGVEETDRTVDDLDPETRDRLDDADLLPDGGQDDAWDLPSDSFSEAVECPECGGDAWASFYSEEVEYGRPTNTNTRGAVAPNYRMKTVEFGEFRCNECETHGREGADALERRS